jgi:hypothetical protein
MRKINCLSSSDGAAGSSHPFRACNGNNCNGSPQSVERSQACAAGCKMCGGGGNFMYPRVYDFCDCETFTDKTKFACGYKCGWKGPCFWDFAACGLQWGNHVGGDGSRSGYSQAGGVTTRNCNLSCDNSNCESCASCNDCNTCSTQCEDTSCGPISDSSLLSTNDCKPLKLNFNNMEPNSPDYEIYKKFISEIERINNMVPCLTPTTIQCDGIFPRYYNLSFLKSSNFSINLGGIYNNIIINSIKFTGKGGDNEYTVNADKIELAFSDDRRFDIYFSNDSTKIEILREERFEGESFIEFTNQFYKTLLFGSTEESGQLSNDEQGRADGQSLESLEIEICYTN